MTMLQEMPRERQRIAATQNLAAFASSALVDRDAIEKAVPAIIDTLAVTIAGSVEPGVKALEQTFEADSGRNAVPSLWGGAALRSDDAALLMGMASHVLDYDDVSMLAICHPSAPILSALLAVRPWNAVTGRELLEAFAVGTEILVRLGQAMGFRHYALGFHATATLGSVGAAAACARLMKLDQQRTAHAIAIAASLSSGLRKNFGSMVKSLHVGLAAASGLKAARLAAAGIQGATEAIDGEGFLNAFSGGETDMWPSQVALGAPFVVVNPGFEQKRYPCCYMLHKMIEASLLLRRESGLDLADVKSIRVEMPPGGTKPLIHPYPKSGMNALFSGPYAVAASLADGRIDLKSFTDAAVLRPEIQARLHDVSVIENPDLVHQGDDLGRAPVIVTLHPVKGEARSRTILAPPGSAEDPLTSDQLRTKWTDCLQRGNAAVTSAMAHALFQKGEGLQAATGLDDWLGALRLAMKRP